MKAQDETIQASVDVTIPGDWFDFLVNHNDIFFTSYAGYWMRGIEYDEELGWLVYEQGDDALPSDKLQQEAIGAWKDPTSRSTISSPGEGLPDHFFRIDAETARAAFIVGVKKWGLNWYEEADANSYDVVIQLALLGEIRYG